MLAALLALTACDVRSSDERQQEQRVLRAQRLARARAQRARQARQERLRKKRQPRPGVNTAPAPPPLVVPQGPCVPAEALKKKVASSRFNDQFAAAVAKVLTPIRADLVELGGEAVQRFTFTVRMHPGDEPRFGRRRTRSELQLVLRFTPLCSASPTHADHRLRVHLVKETSGKRDPRTTTALWPHRNTNHSFRVPVGVPIQLLLDPTRATLGKAPGPASAPQLGAWQLQAAEFTGRPRLRRRSLATSKLPDALRQLHVVEVKCDRAPDKRCRYLTRRLGRRSLVTTWKQLVKLAAPIKTPEQVRQLHAADLQLRYPKCGGEVRQTPGRYRRHRCFRRGKRSLSCLFWRAFRGHGNEAQITTGATGVHVHHVLACPGKKLRVLELSTTYGRKGSYSLSVTDLSGRGSVLLQRVRQSTPRWRRRRRRRRRPSGR